ncbi:MAG: acyl-CoA thioesterase [Lachnospiraceae bacterium]|nr:acyl-CoA thioesterase [Lachnospiraceae bacterium]
MDIYTRKINYYDTDKMSVVHHSNYIRYMEEARIHLMDEWGIGLEEIEKLGLVIPVLSVTSNYIKPARFGEDIEVRTKLTGYNGVKFSFEYEMYNPATGELLNTGNSSHAIIRDDMTPINIKRKFPDLYKKFMEISEEEMEK